MINAATLKLILVFLVIFNVANADNNESVKSEYLSEATSDESGKSLRAFDANPGERIGPFKNIFAGIFTNYKSTYLGNLTASEHQKDFRLEQETTVKPLTETPEKVKTSKKSKKHRKRKKKRVHTMGRKQPSDNEGVLKYEIGPDVNVTLDMSREVVSVNIDQEYVKDILAGNWLSDSNDGRKKKEKDGGVMMKVLPLFILPFLIQSSILPFLVAKLKLLLLKSIIVGKLAIFLLVVSAIKNSQKVATIEPIPTYFAAEHPSRRSEVFSGYRVEGRPSAWVN